MTAGEIPGWITYPEDDWEQISIEQAGIDPGQWERFLAGLDVGASAWEGEAHGENEWGAVLARGGYLVHTWGDRNYRFQTASLGKAFTWAVFGLAATEGLVGPDDLICKTWTGEGQLSHPHKYLDQGHHRKLTWRHLLGRKDAHGHDGGFPVTNGFYWRRGSSAQMKKQAGEPVPSWAKWTGDPFYDNYAHAAPGTVRTYSSGGIWRLSQALTALWQRDIKQVLDDGLLGKIGIPPDAWEWVPGRTVHEDTDWYPHMPGYGDFIDPPYEFDGHVVRGGGGWVVMGAADLARFGHLVATRGSWKGEQLIDPQWIRGHRGGNDSQVDGESRHYTAMGKVTTRGIDYPFPDDLFAGPVDVAGVA